MRAARRGPDSDACRVDIDPARHVLARLRSLAMDDRSDAAGDDTTDMHGGILRIGAVTRVAAAIAA